MIMGAILSEVVMSSMCISLLNQTMPFRRFIAMVVMATCWLSVATAFGQNYWINPNGGNYNEAANWSQGVPSGGIIGFDLGSPGYTIQITQQEYLFGWEIQTDNPTVSLNDQTFSTSFLNVSTQAGQNGSLTLLGPGTFEQVVQDDSYIDVGGTNCTGQMTINGTTVIKR